jgi:hypothetical protein
MDLMNPKWRPSGSGAFTASVVVALVVSVSTGRVSVGSELASGGGAVSLTPDSPPGAASFALPQPAEARATAVRRTAKRTGTGA